MFDKEVCERGCVTKMCERWCVTKCERGRRTEEAEEELGGTDVKTRAPHKDVGKNYTIYIYIDIRAINHYHGHQSSSFTMKLTIGNYRPLLTIINYKP